MVPEKVRAVLDAHGLELIEFEPGSTPTAPTAARALGVQVGQIAKSMLFVGRDRRFFLVVCPGDRRVSSTKLKKVIGVKARMGSPEETREATGFLPGGVCPFGLDGVEILLDGALGTYPTIYPAGGTDSSAVVMTFPQLVAISGARVGDLTVEPAPETAGDETPAGEASRVGAAAPRRETNG